MRIAAPSSDGSESARTRSLGPLAAATIAALVVAGQVAGKAARDAIFLTRFSATALPTMWVVTSVVSVATAFGVARALTRHGAARFAAFGFAVAALAMVLIWLAYAIAPRALALLLYVHVSVLGAVLVSAFWSALGDHFDPRSAKRHISKILAGGTLGGALGGALAERAGSWFGLPATMLVVALLQLSSAWAIRRLLFERRTAPAEPVHEHARPLGKTETHYLLRLGVLLALVTVSGTFLDYVLKAEASARFSGPSLLQFFSGFHAGVSLFTVALQAALSRPSLERWGLGGTASALPGAVIAGGAVALMLPGFANVAALRGLEAVVRSSLFRSAYELLYTPLTARQRRSAKTFIDVGVDRSAEAFGALVIRGLIAWAPASLHVGLLGGAIALSALALFGARAINREYARALERSLLEHGVRLDGFTWFDRTTKTVLSLHSLQPERAPALVLRDSSAGPAERRRAARALGSSSDPEAASALLEALSDSHFEVRVECARALARLTRHSELSPPDAARVIGAVLREVTVNRAVWESRALYEEDPSLSVFGKTALRTRASQSLEHVFTLLALVLPRRPLIIAYHALESSDARARGTALEYLDSTLPPEVRDKLWPFLEAPAPRARRSRQAILADLEHVSETLRLKLDVT